MHELLTRLDASDVRELEVTRGALRVRVAKDGAGQRHEAIGAPAAGAPANVGRPAQSAGPAVVTAPAAAASDAITAPLTGIFYRSPSPQAASFVEVGSMVASGDVIGLIEAMKLFNEIRSTKSGRVRRIVADNGQLVRARAPLIELDPA